MEGGGGGGGGGAAERVTIYTELIGVGFTLSQLGQARRGVGFRSLGYKV